MFILININNFMQNYDYIVLVTRTTMAESACIIIYKSTGYDYELWLEKRYAYFHNTKISHMQVRKIVIDQHRLKRIEK